MMFPGAYQVRSAHAPLGRELAKYLSLAFRRPPGQEGYPFEIKVTGDGGEGFHVSLGEAGTLIRAGSVRGAFYGVYAFLEKALGCRFLAEDCEIIPPFRGRLSPMEWEEAPAFKYREAYWRGALCGDMALKLRLNSARAQISPEQGGRTPFYNYSHSFLDLLDPEEWFDTHPEYFSLVNGKRQKEKSQLCLTNPRVVELVVEKLRQWIRDNPDCAIFSVAMNDWYGHCECPSCRAVDRAEGGSAGTMLKFVNQVAEAVAQEYPGRFIHTFAYLYCRKPPETLRARDDVIVRLCPIERCFSHAIDACHQEVARIDVEMTKRAAFAPGGRFTQDLEGWARKASNLYIWDYTVNFANYLQPFPIQASLAGSLRYYRAQGVSGVFLQGNYSPGSASAFGALKIYQMSRLMWDPALDAQALADAFVKDYYGRAAAPYVLEALALSEQAVSSVHMSLFDRLDAPYLQEAFLAKLEDLLRTALCNTRDRKRRRRLELELLSPRYCRLAALPLDTPGRADMVEAFARDARALGISELFERRELEASFACLKDSRYALDRERVPHAVYRL